MQISNHVKQHPYGYELADMCCFGTVETNVDGFAAVCGIPHKHDPGGVHSMHFWYFETPRGRACVRDFHTLPDGLLAIVSVDALATRWLCRFLQHAKLKTQIYQE